MYKRDGVCFFSLSMQHSLPPFLLPIQIDPQYPQYQIHLQDQTQIQYPDKQ